MGNVRFILGRAASGKSTFCLRSILELVRANPLGPPVWWIVPSQQTLDTERQLSQQLGAYARVRVASFDQLAREILSIAGEFHAPAMPELPRRVLLRQTLQTLDGRLTHLRGSSRHWGSVCAIDSLLQEFDSNLGASNISTALAGTLSGSELQPTLSGVLQDLLLISQHAVYFDSQTQGSASDPLLLAAKHAGSIPDIGQWNVYVDNILDFTFAQRQLLVALALGCASTHVALLFDATIPQADQPHLLSDHHGQTSSDIPTFFAKCLQAYRRLHGTFLAASVRIQPPLKLMTTASVKRPAILGLVEESMTNPPFSKEAPTPQQNKTEYVRFIEASSIEQESKVVAALVRQCIATGIRYRDITILCRDLAKYLRPMQEALAEHDVPLFLDAARPVSGHPLCALIRLMLNIISDGLSTQTLLNIAKSCPTSLAPKAAEQLEFHVMRLGLTDASWFDASVWQNLSQPDLAVWRATLVDALAPLSTLSTRPDLTGKLLIAELQSALQRLGSEQALERWASELPEGSEAASLHRIIFAETIELLSTLSVAWGDSPADLQTLTQVILAGLSHLAPAIAPPTADQLHLSTIDRAYARRSPVVFVVGLSDGIFPQPLQSEPILSDEHRLELIRNGLSVAEPANLRQHDEHLLAYLAFTRADSLLILTRPTSISDDGTQVAPSAFWQHLMASVCHEVQHAVELLETLPPARQDIAFSISRWMASGSPNDRSAAHVTYQDVKRSREPLWLFQDIRAMDYQLAYKTPVELTPLLRAAHFMPGQIRISPADIESFAECPFSFFAKRKLTLESRRDRRAASPRRSDLLRRVLKSFASMRQPLPKDPAQLAGVVESLATAVAGQEKAFINSSDPSHKLLLSRVCMLAGTILTIWSTLSDTQDAKASSGASVQSFKHNLRLNLNCTSDANAQSSFSGMMVSTPTGPIELTAFIDAADWIDDSLLSVFSYDASPYVPSLSTSLLGLGIQPALKWIIAASLSQQAGAPVPAGLISMPIEASVVQAKTKHLTDPQTVVKPRPAHLLSESFAHTLLNTPAAETLGIRITNAGHLHKNSAIPDHLFALWMEEVKKVAIDISRQMTSGYIAVSPYKLGTQSPCPNCPYQSLCRFEPPYSRYRYLTPPVFPPVAPSSTSQQP